MKHETVTPDNQQVTDETPPNSQMLAREQNLNYTVSFSAFFVHSTIHWPVALHDEAQSNKSFE